MFVTVSIFNSQIMVDNAFCTVVVLMMLILVSHCYTALTEPLLDTQEYNYIIMF